MVTFFSSPQVAIIIIIHVIIIIIIIMAVYIGTVKYIHLIYS